MYSIDGFCFFFEDLAVHVEFGGVFGNVLGEGLAMEDILEGFAQHVDHAMVVLAVAFRE